MMSSLPSLPRSYSMSITLLLIGNSLVLKHISVHSLGSAWTGNPYTLLRLHHLALVCMQVFHSVAKDVMVRIREQQQAGSAAPAPSGGKNVRVDQQGAAKTSSGGCCS